MIMDYLVFAKMKSDRTLPRWVAVMLLSEIEQFFENRLFMNLYWLLDRKLFSTKNLRHTPPMSVRLTRKPAINFWICQKIIVSCILKSLNDLSNFFTTTPMSAERGWGWYRRVVTRGHQFYRCCSFSRFHLQLLRYVFLHVLRKSERCVLCCRRLYLMIVTAGTTLFVFVALHKKFFCKTHKKRVHHD